MKMRALTIRQPWAWLLSNGHKPVENRSRALHYRGPLLLHASQTMTRADYEAARIFVAGFSDLRLPAFEDLALGAVVGVCARITLNALGVKDWRRHKLCAADQGVFEPVGGGAIGRYKMCYITCIGLTKNPMLNLKPIKIR